VVLTNCISKELLFIHQKTIGQSMGHVQSTPTLLLKTIQQQSSATCLIDFPWVDSYWANFLECTVAQFCEARQTQIIESSTLAGPWAFARQGNWVVVLPTDWRCHVQAPDQFAQNLLHYFRPGAFPKPHHISALFTDFPVQESFGPALVFLHAAPTPHVETNGTIRALTLRDMAQVAAYAATTEIPWTLTEPVIWKKVFGLFVNGQLVSSCAMRIWGDLLAEIYVDTAPEHRCKGYGKAVSHAMLQWIHSATPFYAESIVELSNSASVSLLSHLGGIPYGYVVMSF